MLVEEGPAWALTRLRSARLLSIDKAIQRQTAAAMIMKVSILVAPFDF